MESTKKKTRLIIILLFVFSLVGCFPYRSVEYNEFPKSKTKIAGFQLYSFRPRDFIYWEQERVYNYDNILLELKRSKVHRGCWAPIVLRSTVKKYYPNGKIESIEKYNRRTGAIFCEFNKNGDRKYLFSKEEIFHLRDSLEIELRDSLTTALKTEKFIQLMIESLNSKVKGRSFFPYAIFDSVTYSEFDSKIIQVHDSIDKCKVRTKKLIKQEKVNQLLKLVNNPLNFNWGEVCETPLPEAEFEFWQDENIIAVIVFSCSYGQILCYPENDLTRWGVLNSEGKRVLSNILN